MNKQKETQMPYIAKEDVKKIRDALKAKYSPMGYKLSVVCRHHCSVDISVMSGKVDLTTDNATEWRWNQEEGYNKEARELVKDIEQTVLAAHGRREVVYDGDYGSVPNYYLDVRVGKWDKPYEMVA